MEDMIPCALKDQEVFQRVWQRVMAGREDCGCPIEAIPHGMEGDISCQRLEELVRLNAGRPAEDGGTLWETYGCSSSCVAYWDGKHLWLPGEKDGQWRGCRPSDPGKLDETLKSLCK